jgi:hypothetical protein
MFKWLVKVNILIVILCFILCFIFIVFKEIKTNSPKSENITDIYSAKFIETASWCVCSKEISKNFYECDCAENNGIYTRLQGIKVYPK